MCARKNTIYFLKEYFSKKITLFRYERLSVELFIWFICIYWMINLQYTAEEWLRIIWCTLSVCEFVLFSVKKRNISSYRYLPTPSIKSPYTHIQTLSIAQTFAHTYLEPNKQRKIFIDYGMPSYDIELYLYYSIAGRGRYSAETTLYTLVF